MTGFGRCSLDSGGIRVTVEARSVNQKGLFVGVRTPREYAALEERIRDAVRTRFSRGRIDIALRVDAQAAGGWVVAVAAGVQAVSSMEKITTVLIQYSHLFFISSSFTWILPRRDAGHSDRNSFCRPARRGLP